jgi:hypothetical protein
MQTSDFLLELLHTASAPLVRLPVAGYFQILTQPYQVQKDIKSFRQKYLYK